VWVNGCAVGGSPKESLDDARSYIWERALDVWKDKIKQFDNRVFLMKRNSRERSLRSFKIMSYLRRVIENLSTHASGVGKSKGDKCAYLKLECGHTVIRPMSRLPKKVFCPDCAVLDQFPESPIAKKIQEGNQGW